MEIDLEQLRNYIDERTHTIRDRNEYTFNFGKYKGYRVLEVFTRDPQYLIYLYENVRHKISPKIDEFIQDNSLMIKAASEDQEKKRLSLFS
jgi:hypothetical protein